MTKRTLLPGATEHSVTDQTFNVTSLPSDVVNQIINCCIMRWPQHYQRLFAVSKHWRDVVSSHPTTQRFRLLSTFFGRDFRPLPDNVTMVELWYFLINAITTAAAMLNPKSKQGLIHVKEAGLFNRYRLESHLWILLFTPKLELKLLATEVTDEYIQMVTADSPPRITPEEIISTGAIAENGKKHSWVTAELSEYSDIYFVSSSAHKLDGTCFQIVTLTKTLYHLMGHLFGKSGCILISDMPGCLQLPSYNSPFEGLFEYNTELEETISANIMAEVKAAKVSYLPREGLPSMDTMVKCYRRAIDKSIQFPCFIRFSWFPGTESIWEEVAASHAFEDCRLVESTEQMLVFLRPLIRWEHQSNIEDMRQGGENRELKLWRAAPPNKNGLKLMWTKSGFAHRSVFYVHFVGRIKQE